MQLVAAGGKEKQGGTEIIVMMEARNQMQDALKCA